MTVPPSSVTRNNYLFQLQGTLPIQATPIPLQQKGIESGLMPYDRNRKFLRKGNADVVKLFLAPQSRKDTRIKMSPTPSLFF